MLAFFKKHLGAILAGTAINLPALWKGAIWLTDWLARFDFWNSYGREIPGVSVMINYLMDPPPWTVFLTSIAAALIVIWDVRRQAGRPASEPVTRDPNKRLLVGFYFGCAAAAVSVWSIYFYVSYSPPMPPPLPAPPTPVEAPKPLTTSVDSTWSRTYYKCRWDGIIPDKSTLEKNTAAFKQYIDVYAETIGAVATFPSIKGGDKADLLPSMLDPDRLGNFAEMTFETRRLGRDLLGIFTAKYRQDPYGAVSGQKMEPGSELEVRIRKRIEDLTGVSRGDCELQ